MRALLVSNFEGACGMRQLVKRRSLGALCGISSFHNAVITIL
jgi:hypothetical protein